MLFALIQLTGTQSFDVALIVVSIGFMIKAWSFSENDVFIDESDSAPSDIADELHGVKATKPNRVLVFCIGLGFFAYAVWELWKR